jgi:apolipoprotein N-acyltransferase
MRTWSDWQPLPAMMKSHNPERINCMKGIIKRLIKNELFAILLFGLIQGLLTSLSLEPFNAPVTGWLMPWPLFYFAGRFRSSVPKLLLSGAVCSLFFCIFTFYWVTHLFASFADMGPVASLMAIIPFSIFFNLQFPAYVLLFGVSLRPSFRKHLQPRWLTAGLLALFCDYCIPKLFPYHWGNFIAGNLYIVQIADLIGIHGLTFMVFAVSYFFYRLSHMIITVPNMREPGSGWFSVLKRMMRMHIWRHLFPVPLLLTLCFCYGVFRMNQILEVQKSLPTVKVAIINPNAPPEDKRFVNKQILEKLMFTTITGLVREAADAAKGSLDLVVLPESAVPFMCADDSPASRQNRRYSPESEIMVQRIAYNWNVDVFFNETVYKSVRNGRGGTETKIYNSSVLYSRDGRRRDSYHKRRLLAFGEYMPGEKLLKSLGLYNIVQDIVGSSRFSAGPSSNLISYSIRDNAGPINNPDPVSYESLRMTSPRDFENMFPKDRHFTVAGFFLPLICYESLLPDHVRSFFDNREKLHPDFIVNITQDGWYGNTIETYQHFELARIRAVETRRALVRSVNNGAAGFVDVAGRYVLPLAGPKKTAAETAGFQVWDVPVNREMKTIYIRFGDTWVVIPIFLMVALWLWRIARARKRKNRFRSGPAGQSTPQAASE